MKTKRLEKYLYKKRYKRYKKKRVFRKHIWKQDKNKGLTKMIFLRIEIYKPKKRYKYIKTI